LHLLTYCEFNTAELQTAGALGLSLLSVTVSIVKTATVRIFSLCNELYSYDRGVRVGAAALARFTPEKDFDLECQFNLNVKTMFIFCHLKMKLLIFDFFISRMGN